MGARSHTVPTGRFVLAWALMVGGLVGFWCCRPWLNVRVFNYGQVVVLLVSWKVAALLCLPAAEWRRFTRLRLLAFCLWPSMQPRQFLAGARTPPGAPVPTVRGFLLNLATGAVLFWGVPRVLPDGTPRAVRLGVALAGFCFLELIARFDLLALVFRAMGFAVEKVWDCPIAATSLDEFWGRRWNRIVSGGLREVVFLPLARRAGTQVALLAVFLYSGLYHEIISFLAGGGYGGPMAYFLVQYLGTVVERSPVGRRLLRGRPLAGWVWTLAVVTAPLGLLLQSPFVDGCLVPLLSEAGVPGLEP